MEETFLKTASSFGKFEVSSTSGWFKTAFYNILYLGFQVVHETTPASAGDIIDAGSILLGRALEKDRQRLTSVF